MLIKNFAKSVAALGSTRFVEFCAGLILVTLSEYPELNNINFIVGILFLFSVYFVLKNDEKEFILNKLKIRP